MKAWCVFESNPHDGCILVYANTRNRARSLGFYKGPWAWDWESYMTTNARRAKDWDHVFNEEKIIEGNDELPDGTDKFYIDDDYWL